MRTKLLRSETQQPCHEISHEPLYMHAKLKYLFDILILTISYTVHGFENVFYEVEEEGHGRVDTTFKLNVKGTTNFRSLSLIGRITSEAGPGTGQFLLCVYS